MASLNVFKVGMRMAKKNSEKNKSSKNVSSITNKLYGRMIAKKIGIYFSCDLFLLFALAFGWMVQQEMQVYGNVTIERNRAFLMDGNITTLQYVIFENDIKKVQADAFIPILFILSMVIVAIAFQTLGCLLSSYGEYRGIKKTLKQGTV